MLQERSRRFGDATNIKAVVIGLNLNSQPLFIIGAPRSGTTFLCNVLNQHPLIGLTSESRVFVWLKDLLEISSGRPHLIGSEIREQFVDFVHKSAGEWIERFYREGLGITAPIWGDKHPPYADPALLSGRKGAYQRLPRSGSSLRLIKSCLPTAKFIHIHRDPSHVAHSLVIKGWTRSMEDGVRVWRQYVTEVFEFFGELDDESRLSISYRDLLDNPEPTIAAIGCFLGLPDCTPIESFLEVQRLRPTPFSDPVTELSAAYQRRAAGNLNARTLLLAGENAERLGYAPQYGGSESALKGPDPSPSLSRK
jgi:LPS sulfotransferase NodH